MEQKEPGTIWNSSVEGRCMESEGLTPGTIIWGEVIEQEQINNGMLGTVELPDFKRRLGMLSIEEFKLYGQEQFPNSLQQFVIIEPADATPDHPSKLAEAFSLRGLQETGGIISKITRAEPCGRFLWGEGGQLCVEWPEPIIFD